MAIIGILVCNGFLFVEGRAVQRETGCILEPSARRIDELAVYDRIPDSYDSILSSYTRVIQNQLGVQAVTLVFRNDFSSAAFVVKSSLASEYQTLLGFNRKTSPDGLVFVHREFLTGSFSEVRIPYVLAHEYSHLLQLKKKVTIKKKELHADFMAGWLLAQNQELYVRYGNLIEDERATPILASVVSQKYLYNVSDNV